MHKVANQVFLKKLSLGVSQKYLEASVTEHVTNPYGSAPRTRNPGDVWESSDHKYRAKNQSGVIRGGFPDQETAKNWAMGKTDGKSMGDNIDKSDKEHEGVEQYIQQDVEEVFSELEKEHDSHKVKSFWSIPDRIKAPWKKAKEEVQEALEDGEKTKALVTALGRSISSLGSNARQSGAVKKVMEWVDRRIFRAKTVSYSGNSPDMVKVEFKAALKEMKAEYDRKKKESKTPEEEEALNKEFQERYDQAKSKYAHQMTIALDYSEGSNYRMMGKYVSNMVLGMLGKEDQKFELEPEEENTARQYIGYTLANMGIAVPAALLAPVPYVGYVLQKAAGMIAGSIFYMFQHKGMQKLVQGRMKKLVEEDADPNLNIILDDVLSGYRSYEELELDMRDELKKIEEDPNITDEEKKERKEKIRGQFEDAMERGKDIFLKYGSVGRIAWFFLTGKDEEGKKIKSEFDKKKTNDGLGKMLTETLAITVESFEEYLKEDPKEAMKAWMESGMDEVIKLGEKESKGKKKPDKKKKQDKKKEK